jgi:hypothetical protein
MPRKSIEEKYPEERAALASIIKNNVIVIDNQLSTISGFTTYWEFQQIKTYLKTGQKIIEKLEVKE